jgi:site-specific DNA-cytosine methylase
MPTTSKLNVVVISLFDGLSGGRIALENVPNLNILRYYSSEVDKYAIKVANKNYPEDDKYRLGDVKQIDFTKLLNSINTEFPTAKLLLLGGSPCQGFSMAGKMKGSSTKSGVDVVTLEQYLDLKQKNFEFDGQSYLFWEYIRALEILKPDYFLLENVKVTGKWLPMFNQAIGVKPIFINSNLLSAHNRPRYYWTNIPGVELPTDKNINLLGILEPLKITALIDSSIKPSVAVNIKRDHTLIQNSKKAFFTMKVLSGFSDNKVGLVKSPCLRAGNSSTYVWTGSTYRMLTPLEWERLQTLPDNYTLVLDKNGKQTVSKTQRYRMIGNGWTIAVVSHILRFIKL